MKVITSTRELDYQWAGITTISSAAGIISYVAVLAADQSNVTVTAFLLAMLMVQMAVKANVQQPDAAINAVWLGLDVAWDLYLGAGIILFGLAMFWRRGLSAWLGMPGCCFHSPEKAATEIDHLVIKIGQPA